MKTLTLKEFASVSGTQGIAANKLGCNQANIAKHLREVSRGDKQVLVSVDGEQVIDFAIVKPLRGTCLSLTYQPNLSAD